MIRLHHKRQHYGVNVALVQSNVIQVIALSISITLIPKYSLYSGSTVV